MSFGQMSFGQMSRRSSSSAAAELFRISASERSSRSCPCPGCYQGPELGPEPEMTSSGRRASSRGTPGGLPEIPARYFPPRPELVS